MSQKHSVIKAFNFLTSTSIFIALNGLLVGIFSSLLYGVKINVEVLLVTFLATFSSYSLNKATDKVEDSINRPETASMKSMHFVVPAIIAMGVSIFISATLGVWTFMSLVVPILVSLVYSVKLSSSMIRLKEIVGVKSLVVAFSWAFTGSFLPASIHFVEIEKIVLVFLFIFFQILVNTIIFDIMDMNGDSFSGVKTIPILLGLKKTKFLLFIIDGMLVFWLIFCLIEGIFIKYILSLTFEVFYNFLIIYLFSNGVQNRLLVEFTVDGEWFPLVVLMV